MPKYFWVLSFYDSFIGPFDSFEEAESNFISTGRTNEDLVIKKYNLYTPLGLSIWLDLLESLHKEGDGSFMDEVRSRLDKRSQMVGGSSVE
jgi:hypothetical protein